MNTLLEYTLDFETFFERGYKMGRNKNDLPMSEYVRDKRFRSWGFSVKVGNKRPVWIGGTHAEQKAWLKKQPWKRIRAICHNARFDGLILTHVFKVHPAEFVCTQFMANPFMQPNHGSSLEEVSQVLLGSPPKPVAADEWKGKTEFTPREAARMARRANDDVRRTYRVYKHMLKTFPEAELKLIDETVKLFVEPRLVLDAARVERVGRKHTREKRALMREAMPDIRTYAERTTILSSDWLFAKYLHDRKIKVPMKWSQKQEQKVPAFAANDLEFMSWRLDEKLEKFYYARTTVKSTQKDSKVSRLLAQRPPYRVAVALKYHGAHTQRFSGDDKSNFQNLERESDLRKSLTAPKGYRVAAVDASQIEARLNAYAAGQFDLLAEFEQYDTGDKSSDPYKLQAADVYKQPVEDITPAQRFVGKTLVLAAGYNMGAEKFQLRLATDKYNALKIPYLEAVQAIDSYRTKNHAIAGQWSTLNEMLWWMERGATGTAPDTRLVSQIGLQFMEDRVLMPNNLFLRYPDLSRTVGGDMTYEGLHRSRRKIYGGLFTENIIQCLARILLCEHLLEIARLFKIVLTVHDEIVFLIPEKNADRHFKTALAIAQKAPAWAPDLPVAAEGVHAKEYAK